MQNRCLRLLRASSGVVLTHGVRFIRLGCVYGSARVLTTGPGTTIIIHPQHSLQQILRPCAQIQVRSDARSNPARVAVCVLRCLLRERGALGGTVTESAAFFRLVLFGGDFKH